MKIGEGRLSKATKVLSAPQPPEPAAVPSRFGTAPTRDTETAKPLQDYVENHLMLPHGLRKSFPLKGYIGNILGLYGDNGKENGNYYITIGYISTVFCLNLRAS